MIPQLRGRWATTRMQMEAHFYLAIGVFILAFFVIYQLLFLRHRPYDVDNTWFLSFTYNHNVLHIDYDRVFGVLFPAGMGGVEFFGKIAAALQGAWGALFGYQQRPMSVLSALCVAAALGCWAIALKRQGFSARFVFSFLLIAGVAEPAVSASNLFRYEPFSFLLFSGGLLLGTFDFAFAAFFFAGLAVEIQPIAVIGVAVVALLCLNRQGFSWRLLGEALLACAMIACILVALHPPLLHLPALMARARATDNSRNGGIAYFQRRDHYFEAACLILLPLMLFLSGRRIPRSQLWIPGSAIAAFILLSATHPNRAYAMFEYPVLLLLTLSLLPERFQRWLVLAMVLFSTAEYSVFAWANRGQGYSTADISRIQNFVAEGERRLNKHDDGFTIFGDYTVWYAHPRNFAAAADWNPGGLASSDAILCYNKHPPGLSQPASMMTCSDILKRRPLRLLASITIRGNDLSLYVRPEEAYNPQAPILEQE